jgi:hypothetical protein
MNWLASFIRQLAAGLGELLAMAKLYLLKVVLGMKMR